MVIHKHFIDDYNTFCSSLDITIGAVTSLHRICEAVDSLTSTAQSHKRAFVVEVMGRHCGWLGLMAGIAVSALLTLVLCSSFYYYDATAVLTT